MGIPSSRCRAGCTLHGDSLPGTRHHIYIACAARPHVTAPCPQPSLYGRAAGQEDKAQRGCSREVGVMPATPIKVRWVGALQDWPPAEPRSRQEVASIFSAFYWELAFFFFFFLFLLQHCQLMGRQEYNPTAISCTKNTTCRLPLSPPCRSSARR